MKRYILFNILIILTLFNNLSYTQQQEETCSNLSYGIEGDFNNQYLWRGFSINKGFMTMPSVYVSAYNLTLTLWGNVTIYDINDYIKQHECDVIIKYEKEFGNWKFEPAISNYNYPNELKAPSTAEFNLKISYELNQFELFINPIIDFVEYPGAYFEEFGIAFNRELSEAVSINSIITGGWASKKFNETYNGLSSATFSYIAVNLSVPYYIKNNIYIKPHVEFYFNLDSDLKKINDSNFFNIGVACGAEF
jgi:hypothetical protein